MEGKGIKKPKKLPHLPIMTLFYSKYLKNFRECFIKDELPSKLNRKKCEILNLNNSDQNGSHWTAWYPPTK